jgi:hypothetical protein
MPPEAPVTRAVLPAPEGLFEAEFDDDVVMMILESVKFKEVNWVDQADHVDQSKHINVLFLKKAQKAPKDAKNENLAKHKRFQPGQSII